jgi:hypothetical protein
MSIVIGLIGVFVGAFLASWLARGRAVKEARVRHTLNLVEEFHSRDMLMVRNVAKAVLTSDTSQHLTIEECQALGEDKWIAISTMLHYFDKVEVMLETRWVEYKLLDRLLGRYIRIWTMTYLDPNRLLDQSEWHDLIVSIVQLSRRFGSPDYVISTPTTAVE